MIKKLLSVFVFGLLLISGLNHAPGGEIADSPYFSEEVLFPQEGIFFYRIPTMITTKEGTVFAAVNARWGKAGDFAHTTLVARRRTSGKNWEPIRTVGGDEKTSCTIGSSVYDPQKNRIFLFGGGGIYISEDDAKSFSFENLKIYPNKKSGKSGGTHGSAPGKMLLQGEHAGRLLVPARYAYGKETEELQRKPKEFAKFLQEKNYNCAIFSDDHGATWNTSGPVQIGTGEGSFVELKDGRIFYNSRAYFLDGKRRTAISTDGGSTFGDFKIAEDLVEPPFGCNASMIRITTRKGDDFLLYSGPQNEKKRTDLCIMISRDNGSHWKRLFNFTPGVFGAYSALAWSEKDQRICLLYESNKYNPKINYGEFVFAEFNPEWIYRLERSGK
ncbi:MAG: sialidase family protein [Planctomycetia bacterium]|nr:sialidase family protein [Planctomycetia bacterium]